LKFTLTNLMIQQHNPTKGPKAFERPKSWQRV